MRATPGIKDHRWTGETGRGKGPGGAWKTKKKKGPVTKKGNQIKKNGLGRKGTSTTVPGKKVRMALIALKKKTNHNWREKKRR